MKMVKFSSFILASAMFLSTVSYTAVPVYADNESNIHDDGLVLSKTATINEDGKYKISLESYATGTSVITDISLDVPTDIVLVLDQSGSMGFCMTCGEDIRNKNNPTHPVHSYSPVYENQVNTNNTYYYFDEITKTYKPLYYCSKKPCNGWFDTKHYYFWDHQGTQYYPKQSENDISEGKVQFYSVNTSTESCSDRLTALKTAVNSFLQNVYNKSAGADGVFGTNDFGTSDDVNHRISIVGFASDNGSSFNNTEILSLPSVKTYSEQLNDDDYYPSLVSVYDENYSLNNLLITAVDRLDHDGATYINYGLVMANKIFDSHASEYSDKDNPRNKVVVVFTDGSPGQTGEWGKEYNDGWYYHSCDAEETADKALASAKTLKNDKNATLYTVGIFNGADASHPDTLPEYKLPTNYYNNYDNSYDESNANRFMHLMSSNYLEAEAMDKTGELNPKLNGDSYYLSAGDSESLNDIFQKISEKIESSESSTTLGSNSIIKDIISPQFTLPDGANKNDISIETYECIGLTEDGKYNWQQTSNDQSVYASINGDEVSVTGFDFSENYVSVIPGENGGYKECKGKKLVITFVVEPKAGFIGGNNVYTNVSAGIYENVQAEKPVKEFNRPQVNVPIQFNVVAKDFNIYCYDDISKDTIMTESTISFGNESNLYTIDLSKADDEDKPYGLEKWQTEYVDIAATILENNNEIPSNGYENIIANHQYTWQVTISPKSKGETDDDGNPLIKVNDDVVTETDLGNITVFYPNVELSDIDIYYGDNSPEFNHVIEWKDLSGNSASNNMYTQEPKVSVSYSYSESIDGNIDTKNNVFVNMNILREDKKQDITSITKFNHVVCEDMKNGGTSISIPDGYRFVLHNHTCSMTIEKNGGETNEPYIFTIKKKNPVTGEYEKYSEVSIVGNNSKTIFELPVGDYTVEEDTDWSWRYRESGGFAPTYKYTNSKANSKGETITSSILSSTNPSSSVTVTNTKTFQYWLNGFSKIVQNIFRKTASAD